MQNLDDALARQLPADHAWTGAAVAALGVSEPASLQVVAVAKGWMRLHDGREPTLVDTLFVLMEDRLGFGQIEVASASDWVALSAVVAIDLIEGVPYPLDPIEVQFAGGFAIFVGWTGEFTDAVLAALQPQVPQAPPPIDEPVDAETVDDPLSRLLARDRDVGVVAAQTDAPPTAPEPPVFEPDIAAVMSPTGPLELEEIVEPDFEPDSDLDDPPTGPHLAPLFGPDAATAIGAGDRLLDPLDRTVEDAFFADLEHSDDPNPTMFSVSAPDEHEELPEVPVGAERVAGPWDDPAIQWPDPLRNCVFLGGHPQHQRRRKNVLVVMRPGGLVIAGGRQNGWSAHVPWHEVARLDVQGADEVKFTHNHRIDLNGSALIVELKDRTSLLVEVRGRRPATLRAGLAPVIAIAGGPGALGGSGTESGGLFGPSGVNSV